VPPLILKIRYFSALPHYLVQWHALTSFAFWRYSRVSMFVNLDVRDFDPSWSPHPQCRFSTYLDWFRRIGIRPRGLRDGFHHSPAVAHISLSLSLSLSLSAALCYCAALDWWLCLCVNSELKSQDAHTTGSPLPFGRPSVWTPLMLYMIVRLFCIFNQTQLMQSDTKIVYSSAHSTTCFGLIDHYRNDQEYNSMYTVMWMSTSYNFCCFECK
jgi:hypothetical protein